MTDSLDVGWTTATKIDSPAHIHAFGMITMNAAMMEEALTLVLAYFLRLKLEISVPLIHKIGVGDRSELIRQIRESHRLPWSAERQVFDIVAVNMQQLTPDLADAAPKARALHLRMLRHAIERGPDDLQAILKEVLELPERKQKELAALLQETTLSAIITAARTVADRLKFIAALESIVFDPETKGRLKERSQLHKILAEKPCP
jgi:hypothetical protein